MYYLTCYCYVILKNISLLLKIASLLLRHSRVLVGTRGPRVTRGTLHARASFNRVIRDHCVGYTHSGGWRTRVTRGHVAWTSTHGAWVRHAAWTPRG